MLIMEFSYNFLYVWNCMKLYHKKFFIYGNFMIRSFDQPGSVTVKLEPKFCTWAFKFLLFFAIPDFQCKTRINGQLYIFIFSSLSSSTSFRSVWYSFLEICLRSLFCRLFSSFQPSRKISKKASQKLFTRHFVCKKCCKKLFICSRWHVLIRLAWKVILNRISYIEF